ncbi:hypothetical protein QQ045_029445 [Rhodiola kirilowii]
MRMERQIVIGSDRHQTYGLNIRKDNSSRWESFNYIWSCYLVPFLAIVQIIASATVLVLSKHEQPHVQLRTWIVGILSAAVATLVLFGWYYFYNKRCSDMVSTYDLDAILEGNSPVTGTDLRLIRFFARAETPLVWFKFLLTCFIWIWLIVGGVWIWKESSSRFDALLLYWLCMSLAILGGIGCLMQLLLFGAGCYYS